MPHFIILERDTDIVPFHILKRHLPLSCATVAFSTFQTSISRRSIKHAHNQHKVQPTIDDGVVVEGPIHAMKIQHIEAHHLMVVLFQEKAQFDMLPPGGPVGQRHWLTILTGHILA